MIPNNNRLIYLKFKKQPLNRKWFVIAVVFSLWIQLLMGVTINFEDLEPGKHGENNYHVWVYFKDKNNERLQQLTSLPQNVMEPVKMKNNNQINVKHKDRITILEGNQSLWPWSIFQ